MRTRSSIFELQRLARQISACDMSCGPQQPECLPCVTSCPIIVPPGPKPTAWSRGPGAFHIQTRRDRAQRGTLWFSPVAWIIKLQLRSPLSRCIVWEL